MANSSPGTTVTHTSDFYSYCFWSHHVPTPATNSVAVGVPSLVNSSSPPTPHEPESTFSHSPTVTRGGVRWGHVVIKPPTHMVSLGTPTSGVPSGSARSLGNISPDHDSSPVVVPLSA